jgi:hypothetical protein
MQLTDIITNENWHGDRLAVFTTTTTAGAELQISEWLEDDGLDVELRDSHARANHADELATLEAAGRDAFAEMRAALQPATLDELAEMMRDGQVFRFDDGTLPTFGGDEPTDTCGVWSWDATRAIVGNCRSNIEIITRAELAQ